MKANRGRLTPRKSTEKGEERWVLKLYVGGETPRSLVAFENLTRICKEKLNDRYTIEVIDLLKNPQLAKEDQILAIPTVVRKLPPPLQRVIGDLSNTERVLVGLNLLSKDKGSAV